MGTEHSTRLNCPCLECEEQEFQDALDNNYVCADCGEVRRDEDGEIDGRVQAGMKCSLCAYGKYG